MKKVARVIQKLRKPPAGHNWVKNIRPRRDATAFALHNFAVNPPRTSLRAIMGVCAAIAVDGISLEQALKCVNAVKDPATAERGKWIARAFHQYCVENQITGVQIFRDMVEHYPVSAGVRVPVQPTFVLNEEGKLVPYFLICWAKFDLTEYQKRILATLISETILSLEEFQGSDAVVVCAPVAPYCKHERCIWSWRVSEKVLLSEDEKQDLFDRYAAALNDAEAMIIESLG